MIFEGDFMCVVIAFLEFFKIMITKLGRMFLNVNYMF